MSQVVVNAIIYSCIAFSIVFVVLGGLTLVIYAMRLTTGAKTPPASGSGSAPAAPGQAAPAGQAAPSGQAMPAVAVNVKAQHVAAITAAILAATLGRGRVLSIAPVQGQGQVIPSLTTRWRSAAILENAGRRLAPSWKR